MDRDVQADAPAEPQPQTAAPLLPKLDDDLPPLPAGPRPAMPSGTAPKRQEEPASDPSLEAGRSERSAGESAKTPSRPRGTGGRPAAAEQPVEAITKVPARVPAELYAAAQPLVKGVGKPSWGQLIAWTCQDHKDEVVSAVLEHARTTARRPRGQNLQGTPGLQVTARLDRSELPVVDEVMKLAGQKAERKVNRTMVVIAALTVATQHAAA
jgi:hypothetical protein